MQKKIETGRVAVIHALKYGSEEPTGYEKPFPSKKNALQAIQCVSLSAKNTAVLIDENAKSAKNQNQSQH